MVKVRMPEDTIKSAAALALGGYNLKRYVFILVAIWTAALAGVLSWHLADLRKHTTESAAIQARYSFDRDLAYRRWTAMRGGVYAPISEETPPNSHLDHLDERDISTPSGRRLTLVNPAYMTRQVHELGREEFGHQAHITSLDPIRPENDPDPWERKAMEAFKKGEEEVTSTEPIDGEPHLRLMRPLFTEKSCLKCHAAQGYQVGDLRGGISISVPMSPLWASHQQHAASVVIGYSLIWLLGLGGIGLMAQHIGTGIRKHSRMEEQLTQHRVHLEELIEERTAEIRKQKEELTDSIEYASRIQRALLPPDTLMAEYSMEHFILFRPRDIVSGDFYWMGLKNDKLVIVAADCTGHGVPGAFMSMLGMTFLDEIVIKAEITSTDEILKQLREHVINSLNQSDKSMEESTKTVWTFP